jgi:hypothetical protein
MVSAHFNITRKEYQEITGLMALLRRRPMESDTSGLRRVVVAV